ncbi:ArsR family transcriptional regulator [Streptomyces sp. ms191]|uniref:winged helix-turn-helix domain-containing protein n=1 Tax=Streptomyces sp. ms191 TaxID=1827978 RepID=UPI0011CDD351|nr:helix-turn-helix domain-containing protein [Streptomyces sp. ms191]TXS29690.1 ArsR family transcriptional regulator [Streptomyces sp. ms191]
MSENEPAASPSGDEQPRSIRLTDPRALRAYAHPTRMTLVGLLRRSGPFTATRAAELTGESVASCSYHLRILAKYGLVEEAPGGRGREKPWRATARYTDWPGASEDAAVAQAADALTAAAAERYFARVLEAMKDRSGLPREWREAEQFGDTLLYLTPAELADFGRRVEGLLMPYEARGSDPSLRPDGARPVSILRIAYLDRELPDGPGLESETDGTAGGGETTDGTGTADGIDRNSDDTGTTDGIDEGKR